MTRSIIYTIVLATAVPAATAAEPATQYLAAREVVLELDAASDTPLTRAELWVSTDTGQTWTPVTQDAKADPRLLRFNAPRDGSYDLYAVLWNEAGPSGPLPTTGSPPTSRVIVDTTVPLLQIHRAAVVFDPTGTPHVRFDATLVEEHLASSAVRVFYQDADQTWIDAGPARSFGDELRWTPPQPLEAPTNLRVVVTDLAGNRGSDDVTDFRIPASPPTRDPPTLVAGATILAAVQPVAPVRVDPVAPVTLSPASASPPATAAGPNPRVTDLDQLRDLAHRLMREGRFDLAAARFTDALALAPDDADLQVDLGSALYRMGRYDDACERFATANKATPTHLGALDGLALVAATQKRYPDARAHLQHLLELQPDAGLVWLRLGDIEHRLGNRDQALGAWARVLETDADSDLQSRAQRRLDYFAPHDLVPGPTTRKSDVRSPQKPPAHRDPRRQ